MLVAAAVDYDEILTPLVLGLALFGLVLIFFGDRRTLVVFAAAIVASELLAFGSTLMSLCTLESDDSRYVERCSSGSYEWPLLGIPVLLALALFGRSLRGPTMWLIGAVVFLTALAVPFLWLATAR